MRRATEGTEMRLGFGCVNLGSASGHATRADVRLVREAVDAGVTVFDTAGAYGSGASERVLGRALRGRRDRVVLATKAGYVYRERPAVEQSARRVVGKARRLLPSRGSRTTTGGGRATGGAYRERDDSPRELRRAVESSLRRLETDHIDVLQLHGPQEVHPELFEEVRDLVDAGKVGRFGIGAESVASAVAWLAVPAVDTVQVPFGVLDPEAADELLPLVERRPVDVWVRGVLGGGLLALAVRDPEAVVHDPKAPQLRALADLAARSGIAVDALAVGYVRTFADISTVLVGIGSRAHLERNLALMAGPPLDDAVLAELTSIAAVAGGVGG